MKKRAAVLNLGCKVNHYEAEAIKQQFSGRGYELTDFQEEADVYVINTCTVTGEAARKSRQMVRRARRRNMAAVVVAVGCDVEMEADRLEADIVVGNQGKARVAELVEDFMSRLGRASVPPARLDLTADIDQLTTFEELGSVVRQNETRAILKVQDGCNQFCSYCAIPYVRGRVRSRAPEAVVQEARELVAAGFKELVVTGIHVCSYGTDRHEKGLPLLDLCDRLAELPGLERIRLGSLEPKSVTADFARRFGQNPKLCPHVHLSLQSGSDRILALMRRRYTTADYRSAVTALRCFIPHILLTTDVITGFPGERPKDHLESLEFCREIAFSKIHTFRYSPREGTVAARLPDQVPGPEAEARSRDFLALSEAGFNKVANSLLGQVAKVLFEEQTADGFWTGYTEGYLPVYSRLSEQIKNGVILPVRLQRLADERIYGEPAVAVGPAEGNRG